MLVYMPPWVYMLVYMPPWVYMGGIPTLVYTLLYPPGYTLRYTTLPYQVPRSGQQ